MKGTMFRDRILASHTHEGIICIRAKSPQGGFHRSSQESRLVLPDLTFCYCLGFFLRFLLHRPVLKPQHRLGYV